MTKTIDFELYGGEVKGSFYPTSHRYRLDGDWTPSVTTALKVIAQDWTWFWLPNCCEDYLKENYRLLGFDDLCLDDVETFAKSMKSHHRTVSGEAAKVGTEVHAYIRAVLDEDGVATVASLDAKPCTDAFHRWFFEEDIEVHASESFIYSREHKYTGQADLDATVDGKRLIIDFKTSKAIYPENWLQTAAYMGAREEEGHGPYGGTAILHLPKDGEGYEFVVHDREQSLEALEYFKHALALQRGLKELK